MATLTRATFQTAYNIQSRSLDDGILGVSRNGNLHKTLDELRQLSYPFTALYFEV